MPDIRGFLGSAYEANYAPAIIYLASLLAMWSWHGLGWGLMAAISWLLILIIAAAFSTAIIDMALSLDIGGAWITLAAIAGLLAMDAAGSLAWGLMAMWSMLAGAAWVLRRDAERREVGVAALGCRRSHLFVGKCLCHKSTDCRQMSRHDIRHVYQVQVTNTGKCLDMS